MLVMLDNSNPLEIPELLRRISLYVTTNDATACARVCKAWSDHFISAIWHIIDFDAPGVNRATKSLAKHGHHIRVVKNIHKLDHFLALITSNPSNLRQLSVVLTESRVEYAYFIDLLRRVNTSLEHIEIYTFEEKDAVPYFAVDNMFPATRTGMTSRLSTIIIQYLNMTKDALSSLLQNCPLLNDLDIRDTTLLPWPIHDGSTARSYKHTGVTRLVASVEQVFEMNQRIENASSLLVHFPNLKTWQTWVSKSSGPDNFSVKLIRDDVARCCPLMEDVFMESSTPLAISILTQAFDGLTSVRILHSDFSAEMAMAILNHQETLRAVATSLDESNEFDGLHYDLESGLSSSTDSQRDTIELIAQSIPRHCARLEKLECPLAEMDMVNIEMTEWKCHSLGELYIRIRGLDTKVKIDRAIHLWKDGRIAMRKKQVSAGHKESFSATLQLDNIIPPDDNSIEAHVARHLLKFKKLRKVWLGWRVHEVM